MFEQTTFPFVGFEASSVMIFVPKDCAGHVMPRWDKTCLRKAALPFVDSEASSAIIFSILCLF